MKYFLPLFTCRDVNPSSIWSEIGQVAADTVGIDSQTDRRLGPRSREVPLAYYWPQYGVAIEVDDDPHLLPFDEEAFPDTAVYHVTTDVICDPESFSALAHHIAHIHNIELPPDFDELVYSRRLMLHMLFGADPSTFARVYTTKDAA